MKISPRQIRQAVAVVSAFLVGANAAVQLWQNLDMGSRLHQLNMHLPAIELVKSDNLGYSTRNYDLETALTYRNR
jgi:hypothetical protein